MPCDRFKKKKGTENLARGGDSMQAGRILWSNQEKKKKSSQWIKFKTGPIKPEFNGGKRL